MTSRQSLHRIVRFNHEIAIDNSRVNDTIDSIVAHVADQPRLDRRPDWTQLHRTFDMMILNSLIHGESNGKSARRDEGTDEAHKSNVADSFEKPAPPSE